MANTMHPRARDRKARILVVDDHPLIREGIARLIDAQADMEVVAEATSAREALAAAAAKEPDLAIVDLSLGDDDGIDLIRDLKTRHPGLEALVLSMHDEELVAERALRAGAMGYVMKLECIQTVVEAIHRVLEGEVYLSPRMTSKTVRRLTGGARPEAAAPLDSLSYREQQVLRLIGEGLGPKAIGERLHISVKTVETHREHIKAKLNLEDATALRKWAIQAARSGLGGGPGPS